MTQTSIRSTNDRVRPSSLCAKPSFHLSCELLGPACRAPVSKQHAYLQAAFDPVIPIEVPDSDEDTKPTISSKVKAKTPVARGKPVKEEDMQSELEDSPKIKAPGRRATMPRSAKTRAAKWLQEPDSDSDSDDSLDDFIVHTDSDEEEKDKIKAAKTQGKKVNRARPRKVKDEEYDEYESDDAESDEGDKKPFFARDVDKKALKPMPRPLASFLPSTKMLVRTYHLHFFLAVDLVEMI
jgi:hypothetical protein